MDVTEVWKRIEREISTGKSGSTFINVYQGRTRKTWKHKKNV